MVAAGELPTETQREILRLLKDHRLEVAALVQKLSTLGLAKEVANRYLAPFQHITSVITATEWDNFFNLRCAPDAQPETRVLAEEIQAALNASKPVLREYHLPYVAYNETHSLIDAAKLSAARCARVSYQSAGKARESDVMFADKLWANGHKSPFQHSAFSIPYIEAPKGSNLKGWIRGREWIEEYYANSRIGGIL
jgi:thymidylate synthase ThyX